ncbi:MAG: hypothetical protein ACE5JF_03040 [Anaerolineales bacterium]
MFLTPQPLVPTLDPAVLAAAQEPRLSLIWGARTPTQTLLAMFTWLAARGESPRVFDGGNRFDGYFVSRMARRLTPRPEHVLGRLHLSRAFTCYQLAQLIEEAQAGRSPVLILDLLNTFYEESTPLREVERLLAKVISHLRRLAAVGPVVVGAREPQAIVQERWKLLEQLQAAADTSWMLRPPPGETAEQPPLL